MKKRIIAIFVYFWLVAFCRADQPSNTFTIATYNVQNWVLMERGKSANAPKPEKERQAVVRVLAGVRPDVLAVEEMGTTNELAELQRALRDSGLDYPHTVWVEGVDPTRHVALLSRFPIVEQFSRTNDTYQLDGRTMRISRGILDVRIQVSAAYSFRAIVAHLKSKRQTDEGDQAVMRREEARLLRRHVEQILQRDANENIVVMGDFNDSVNSEAVQTIAGTNGHRLYAIHARDCKGYDTTHFWKAKREFSRLDYLMLSPGMSNEFITGTARIADPTKWLDASDHRPVSAGFHIGDLGIGRPHR